MKKVLIQNSEQLDVVREEICVSSLFTHPNLCPLLDHAIIAVKGSDGSLDDCVYHLICPCCTLCQVTSHETSLMARCRRVYAHAHDYHINSISNNRWFLAWKCEYFLFVCGGQCFFYNMLLCCPLFFCGLLLFVQITIGVVQVSFGIEHITFGVV
ncbi:unnamed protein product [Camellia sinensis]